MYGLSKNVNRILVLLKPCKCSHANVLPLVRCWGWVEKCIHLQYTWPECCVVKIENLCMRILPQYSKICTCPWRQYGIYCVLLFYVNSWTVHFVCDLSALKKHVPDRGMQHTEYFCSMFAHLHEQLHFSALENLGAMHNMYLTKLIETGLLTLPRLLRIKMDEIFMFDTERERERLLFSAMLYRWFMLAQRPTVWLFYHTDTHQESYLLIQGHICDVSIQGHICAHLGSYVCSSRVISLLIQGHICAHPGWYQWSSRIISVIIQGHICVHPGSSICYLCQSRVISIIIQGHICDRPGSYLWSSRIIYIYVHPGSYLCSSRVISVLIQGHICAHPVSYLHVLIQGHICAHPGSYLCSSRVIYVLIQGHICAQLGSYLHVPIKSNICDHPGLYLCPSRVLSVLIQGHICTCTHPGSYLCSSRVISVLIRGYICAHKGSYLCSSRVIYELIQGHICAHSRS